MNPIGPAGRSLGPALLGALCAFVALPAASAPPGDARLDRIEDHMRALHDELAALKAERDVDRARVEEVEEQITTVQELLERVKVGGYGSVRYEWNSLGDQEDTFTFRRLVFTTDAKIHDRLRFYSELEYERFRELELEREVNRIPFEDGGGLEVIQEVEGTDGSEIALEQAWLEYEIDPRLRIRTGGLLVPLGRFNLHHDDNQWTLPRRPLADRGASALPVSAAWDELGAGFVGDFELGRGSLSYQAFVVNGMVVEPTLEAIVRSRQTRRDVLELEAEFTPQTGTFSQDRKGAKAFTGRLAWQPAPGHEIAVSAYSGRYTPDYLSDRNVFAIAVDGITRVFGVELEGEFVSSRFDAVDEVATTFASLALDRASNNAAAFDPRLEPEIEFELDGLAANRTGYWVEARYPFWPGFLPRGGFEDPKLVPVARMEQVWLNDLVTQVDFANGVVTAFDTDDRKLSRTTVGLGFRPTPLVIFSLAYEYTWTANTESLDGLTNYLRAREREDSAHSLLIGASYGF
jgi:hypothetical protein